MVNSFAMGCRVGRRPVPDAAAVVWPEFYDSDAAGAPVVSGAPLDYDAGCPESSQHFWKE